MPAGIRINIEDMKNYMKEEQIWKKTLAKRLGISEVAIHRILNRWTISEKILHRFYNLQNERNNKNNK